MLDTHTYAKVCALLDQIGAIVGEQYSLNLVAIYMDEGEGQDLFISDSGIDVLKEVIDEMVEAVEDGEATMTADEEVRTRSPLTH